MARSREDKERVLSAWLRVTSSISRLQQLEDLRYNEALICNLLMRNSIENPGELLTATDLCRQSHIMKSQMNRTLQAMEEKGIITRSRSQEDRRRVFTKLREDSDVYARQHEQVLSTVDALLSRVGEDRLDEIVELLDAISEAAAELSDPEAAAGAEPELEAEAV